MTDTINIRELALEALLQIVEKKNLSHIVISQALRKYQYLEKQDRAFFMRLTEGCIERKLTLDYILGQYSEKIAVSKMKPVIRNILRMGVYQILYMDSVPDSAACNEAVKLAGKKGFSSLKGFVNGILRTVEREKKHIVYPDPEKEPDKYLSVAYSMPEWIVKQWRMQYGKEVTEKMLLSSIEEPETCVRFNLSKASREEILHMLSMDHVVVKECPYLSYAFYLSGYDHLEDIRAFREGYLQVQDVSSMMVAEACAVKTGSQIIDVCAAPGGKSLHLADKLYGTGIIKARDLTPYKVQLIEDNRRRCGYENIVAEQWDALERDEASASWADIVLADVPCSGLGVLAKKNDIKYNITEEGQRELIQLQRQILSVVWEYVKPGGILIYSTCTVNREENEENVEWFLGKYPFERESLAQYLPKELSAVEGMKAQLEKGSVTFLPGIINMDGFFLARLRRS